MNVFHRPLESAIDDLEIPGVVDALRSLRAAAQKRRYRGAAPDLPSREATVEIVEGFVAALYPRHFGPCGLKARDIDAFVAQQLAEGLSALRQQVELELRLVGAPDAKGGAREIVAGFRREPARNSRAARHRHRRRF